MLLKSVCVAQTKGIFLKLPRPTQWRSWEWRTWNFLRVWNQSYQSGRSPEGRHQSHWQGWDMAPKRVWHRWASETVYYLRNTAHTKDRIFSHSPSQTWNFLLFSNHSKHFKLFLIFIDYTHSNSAHTISLTPYTQVPEFFCLFLVSILIKRTWTYSVVCWSVLLNFLSVNPWTPWGNTHTLCIYSCLHR